MDDLGARWTHAMRAARFADAWDVSDMVLSRRDPAGRDDPRLPYHLRWVWDGRAFDGRDVLVRCYHGLGDTIQYARCLPALGARAASLTLETQPELIPLLSQLTGIDRIVPFDPAHPLPPAACDIEITELPHALRIDAADLGAPYLSMPAAPSPAGAIGLCHLAGGWNPGRSLPAALLEPFCRRHPCLSLMPQATALPVLNPAGCPGAIEETAAVVAGLDWVVTVDTMIAHLAGALGRPTWLLLKADPDWRWNPAEAGSVWYATMHVLTQATPGDWAPVLARLDEAFAISSLPLQASHEVAPA